MAPHFPWPLSLNFVEVREINPPQDEAPVIWRLVTTEPIDTAEQVAAVVDAYRQRWIIEEFFKALKTGCRYQQLQLLAALAKAETKRPLPDHPTVRDVLLEVARLGGHIKNNGPPGWLILRRGLDKLLSIQRGWILARAGPMDEEM